METLKTMENLQVHSILLSSRTLMWRYPELNGVMHHLSRSVPVMALESKNIKELASKVEKLVLPHAPVTVRIVDADHEPVFECSRKTTVFVVLDHDEQPLH